ncbi:MAG: hypothetical protein ABR507_12305 [Actinomycetota bacterium]|nr:hypothetical protein [Actinomycetota bacterium]
MTYTRKPEHWATDTKQRHVFERQMRKAITDDGEFELLDSTDSFDEVDFELGFRGRRVFLEVKEKRQHYREAWTSCCEVAETDLFILDELSARKIVLRAPRAYLVVNDILNERLVLFSALDLISVPKTRVNRSIDAGVATFKGKWLIDLRHGFQATTLKDALDCLKRRHNSEDELWSSLACYGRYQNERVPRL